MKTLWAPWRIEYITGGKKEGCIFCDKPKEGNDKKNLILYKGETSFIIMNRYPYSNGHLMAVPYRHINNMSELDHKERLELMNLTTKCIEILKVMNPDGFNIGMNLGTAGGAGIDDHLHFHIVPSWKKGPSCWRPWRARCVVRTYTFIMGGLRVFHTLSFLDT